MRMMVNKSTLRERKYTTFFIHLCLIIMEMNNSFWHIMLIIILLKLTYLFLKLPLSFCGRITFRPNLKVLSIIDIIININNHKKIDIKHI